MKKLLEFISGAKAELKKVAWPSRKELYDSTRVVIVASLILAVFIGSVDYLFSFLVNLIFK
ncbi:MAG: preprotein translocase subunit SecE [Candidatus Aureabacteria bacterium]|nr:preprotein translocase subunit SecE [Candidatus Auribacterota bacterium]